MSLVVYAASHIRQGDLAGRVGGEEFYCAAETALKEAKAIAERIRIRINSREILLAQHVFAYYRFVWGEL
ncbi:MAG: diguanylate cyclase domain-containing protein [Enterobacteriaceae bacterium]